MRAGFRGFVEGLLAEAPGGSYQEPFLFRFQDSLIGRAGSLIPSCRLKAFGCRYQTGEAASNWRARSMSRFMKK